MTKRRDSQSRRSKPAPSPAASAEGQPIRWHLVGTLIAAIAAAAALVGYGLGWWPPPTDVPSAEQLGDGESLALQPARLQNLPVEAEFATVEQLRSEADELSRNLRERFPESANAFYIAARQASQFRQYEEAAGWWRRAIELAPELPAPRAGLANVQLEQGNAVDAIEILQTALEKGIRSAEIQVLLVQALQETGELEEALNVCNSALSRYPNNQTLLQERGQIHMQQQHWELARKDFEQLLERTPQARSVRSSLATVLARLGEDTLAAEQRKRYEASKPVDASDDEDFDEIYRTAMQQILVTSLVDAAQEFRKHGDQAMAEHLLVRALALHPLHAAACKSLVSMFREQGRVADAYTVQKRLVKIQPTSDQHINLAGFAIALQKLGEAEAALSAAIESDPNSPIPHRTLALLYLQADHLRDAKSHAEQACRLGGSSQDYQLLARICLRMNDEAGYQTALQNAEDARENETARGNETARQR